MESDAVPFEALHKRQLCEGSPSNHYQHSFNQLRYNTSTHSNKIKNKQLDLYKSINNNDF